MKKSFILPFFALFIFLSACGGGGGGSDNNVSPEITQIEAVDLSVSTKEDVAVRFTMIVLQADISTLLPHIEKNPSHGTVKQVSGATWEYIPYEDFSGLDELEYSLSNDTSASNKAVVKITVGPSGKVLYVAPDSNGKLDGSSWPDAFNQPQEAMDKAGSGDQIWVAKGTYNDLDTDPVTPVLELKAGVRIYGGFSGTEIYRSERSITENASILDGQKKVYHVVTGAQSSRIDGFTIQNGNAKIDSSLEIKEEETGGGMLNENCNDTLVISNCSFLNNNAKGYGGGMTNQGNSSPKIIDCFFTDNNAYYGGGIFNSDGSPYIANCLFQGNNANYGGAILNRKASPSIINCTMSGNNAFLGGALYNQLSSTPLVKNCIMWDDSDNEYQNDNPSMVISYSCIMRGTSRTGNISKNPLFVTEGHRDSSSDLWIPGNYHLKVDSPCIDAADGDSAPFLDLDGQIRLDILSIANTGIGLIPYADMGAFEYMPE